MQTNQDFQVWLADTLRPQLERDQSDAERQQYRLDSARLAFSLKATIWVLGATCAYFFKSWDTLAVSIALPFVLDVYRSKNLPAFHCDVVERYLLPLFQFWSPKSKFVAPAALTVKKLGATQLFPEAFDSVHVTETVQLEHAGSYLQCTALELRKDSNGVPRSFGPPFAGLYLQAKLESKNESSIFVLPRNSQAFNGISNRSLRNHSHEDKGQIIHTAHQEFDQLFETHSNDSENARSFLHPELLAKLIRLHFATSGELRLARIEDRLHVAVRTSKPLLAAPPIEHLNINRLGQWSELAEALHGIAACVQTGPAVLAESA